MKISKTPVWAVDMMNRPGTLARVLESLRNAGANLEFVIARRVTANTSRAFFAPIRGAKQETAARDVDVSLARGMHAIRVDTKDRPGLGADLCRVLGDAGVNIRGLSAASLRGQSVCYFAFGTEAETDRAIAALKASAKKLSGGAGAGASRAARPAKKAARPAAKRKGAKKRGR